MKSSSLNDKETSILSLLESEYNMLDRIINHFDAVEIDKFESDNFILKNVLLHMIDDSPSMSCILKHIKTGTECCVCLLYKRIFSKRPWLKGFAIVDELSYNTEHDVYALSIRLGTNMRRYQAYQSFKRKEIK